jgi:hypothetical protein
MRDWALTVVLNVQIRSYIMLQTSHCFTSLVGGSGVEIVLQTFSLISPCKISDADQSLSYIADMEKIPRGMTRTHGI